MPQVECNLCNTKYGYSFFDFWNCPECGDNYGIKLIEYSQSEIKEVFDFYKEIKKALHGKLSGKTIILAKDLESPDNNDGISLIDTLLCFFDSLIIPDLNKTDVYKLLGEEKADTYYENNLICCSDCSFVEMHSAERDLHLNETRDFDWLIAPLEIEYFVEAPNRNVRYSLMRSVENILRAYLKEMNHYIINSRLNEINYRADGYVEFKGETYWFGTFDYVVPMRFLRNELFSYLYSSDFIFDNFYSSANILREARYLSLPKNYSNFKLFKEWLKTTKFQLKTISANEILEFRDKYGMMGRYVSELKTEVIKSGTISDVTRLSRDFSRLMDERITSYKKISGISLEKKAIYLTGLLSTLGSLVGGEIGALMGGIGGVLTSQLALEFDSKVISPINFITNNVIRS